MLRIVIISKANFTTRCPPGFRSLRKYWVTTLKISETVKIRVFRRSKGSPQMLFHSYVFDYVPVNVPNCMQVVKHIFSVVSKLL
jgi:hypothetical protein